MKRWMIAACIVAAVAQFAVPVALVVRYEDVLRHGRAFKFRLAPVDPADAFRGRYLSVYISAPVTGPVPKADIREPVRRGWAVLDDGPDGFARVSAFVSERPAGADAVPARIEPRYVLVPRPGVPDSVPDDRPWEKRMRVEQDVALMLDRYYVNESRAQRAEALARVSARPAPGGTREAWAIVRAKNGVALLESLWVDGRRLEDATR